MSKVAIIGTGYVGLCTAAGFSKLGHQVKCFDVVESKIEKLVRGEVPIFEEGLQEIIHEGLAEGNLTFHKDLTEATEDAEFTFICVPTPQDENGAADLSYVLEASISASKYLPDGATLVVKSTVPVGAAETIIEVLKRPTINYVSNPEFLREGTAMWDFFHPDRIVVGSKSSDTARFVADLYCQPYVPTIITTTSSAELIKYAANSFLAIKLSFVNEIASICERTGADIEDVANGFGLDSRIGEKFLQPGPGWGGSCFPKDTRALLATSEKVGATSQLVKAAVSSNTETFSRIVNRLASRFEGNLSGKQIAVWGIAFKANTDDTRESPSLEIITRLLDAGALISAYDPIAKLPIHFVNATQSKTALDAVKSADALIVLTEWAEFNSLDAEQFVHEMRKPIVFDTRRILNQTWAQHSDLILVGK